MKNVLDLANQMILHFWTKFPIILLIILTFNVLRQIKNQLNSLKEM